ncbi:S46 family peptidase [candidate division KSB1 bacterium]|nr:S46 family peptidase [candidate division KSB1 bacterium]
MRKLAGVLLMVMFLSTAIQAEEGMWLLNQLEGLNLEKEGLEIPLEKIYNPEQPSLVDAIVWLGGCSASFVSGDGLILTNHHCAYSALQRASTEENNYIKDGFLAKTRAEEIEARGVNAHVLQQMKEVTDDVLKVVKKVSDPLERDKKIRERIKTMTEKIEGKRDDLEARIVDMYNGKQYYLFVFKKYQDVRIVFAPPSSIGNYGDDIDNWMWPRHTGDFTYLRAYMAPNGDGAKYSENNVPVKPKNYLRIASGHLKEGDFTFILGFPGNTTRWRTSNSVRWNLQNNYPQSIRNFSEIIDLMDEITKDSPEGKIKVANLRTGLANVLKNYQGRVTVMNKTNFLQKKIEFENELMAEINKSEELKTKYGTVLKDIEALYAQLAETKDKDDAIQAFNISGTLLGIARQAYSIAREREKPKAEKDPGFSEKDVERNVEQLHLRYYGYYEPFDRAMLKRILAQSKELPDESRIKGLDYVLKHETPSIDEFVDEAFSKTKLADLDYAKSLFSKTSKELEAENDPLINLVAAIYDEADEMSKSSEKFNAAITELRKQYIDALYSWKGSTLYPDANSTIRFTYGHVVGYDPADAVIYKPFTTLKGVIEKNTGVEPFDMPLKLEQLWKDRDFGRWMDPNLNDVPVDFTHRCDITGGNSGSAVMNGKGELIGLAFDGNYEAMSSDWQYDYDIQRTISVDIRYVMFITEKFTGADHLLKEMKVTE